jgi:hypothetical protein
MTWNRQSRLTSAVAAVVMLGLASAVAWGQAEDPWWQELGGSWCDAEEGCTHWWNQYEVEVRGRVVLIRHRDRRFLLFRGHIEQRHKDDGRWKIEAKDKEGKIVTVTVTELKGLKELVQGKIKGKLKAKIEGGKQVEISIPIQISEATIEGIIKPEKKKSGGDAGKEAEDDDDEGDGSGKKRIELEGKFKGKIASPTGQGELKGDFDGDFRAVVQVVVKGVYRVPPPQCSEGGRPLSPEEEGELKERRLREIERRLRKEATSKPSALIGPDSNALVLDEAGEDTRSPGRSRWAAENRRPGEAERKPGPISVHAEKARVEARPTEQNTLGRFMRTVSGTVNGIKPPTITLVLPPLPVLDHRCNVIDELPKRTLKLVKQHEKQ